MVTKITFKGAAQPAWELFDECDTCYTPAQGPCYDMKLSTSKNLVICTNPHRGRKRLCTKVAMSRSKKQKYRNAVVNYLYLDHKIDRNLAVALVQEFREYVDNKYDHQITAKSTALLLLEKM